MGGATEGSIWSNLHEVMVGDEIEASVPYGRGLRNQGMWILNADQEDCVPGQIGEITIGGDGVAVGYFGDSDRTAAAFFTEPDHGELLTVLATTVVTSPMGRLSSWGGWMAR
ncbi:MAG: AMP-binding protein [Lawsonella clevelandensis]